MMVDYIQHWGDDLIVCNAARVSLDKYTEWNIETVGSDDGYGWVEEMVASLKPADEKLIKYLAVNKHTSCFEHMGATLKLKVPIFIARQIQRHRTFSYNEISRRYVDSPPEFFYPDTWRKRADNVKQGSSEESLDGYALESVTDEFEGAIEDAVDAYNSLMGQGVAPELARMILPQNMYTEFYMSGNLRAWSHFLQLRLDGHAQKEVRQVAQQVVDILTPLYPISIDALLNGETN
jgi:thymidylate synthase (FAD)